MATVINNPQGTERTVIDRSSSDASGWVATIIILLALIGFGIYLWTHRGAARTAAPQSTGASINVTVPTGSTGGNGGSTGSGSGSSGSGNSGGAAQ